MKSLISKVLLSIVAVAAVGLAKPVFAGSGAFDKVGVENTFVTSSTYFAQSPSGNYMVTLAGINGNCPGTAHPAFFYTVQTDPGYFAFIQGLDFARDAGRNVKLSYTTDAGGYCHITGVFVYQP
jgi:hypothetical protein